MQSGERIISTTNNVTKTGYPHEKERKKERN